MATSVDAARIETALCSVDNKGECMPDNRTKQTIDA